MQLLAPFSAEIAILPTSFSLTNRLFSRNERVSRSSLFIWGFAAGVGSSAYHALALIKAPVVAMKLALRVTVFQVPVIGRNLDQKLPFLPAGFEYSAPFIHAVKIAAYIFSALFTPVFGLFLPEAVLKLHQKLHLVTVERERRPAVKEPSTQEQMNETPAVSACVADKPAQDSEASGRRDMRIPVSNKILPPNNPQSVVATVDTPRLEKAVEKSCKNWGIKPRQALQVVSELNASKRQSGVVRPLREQPKTWQSSAADKENIMYN